MTYPAAFWPGLLGLGFFVLGIVMWRRARLASTRGVPGPISLGPVFVGASLAAFAGEHFSAAPSLARLVPAFLPGRLFIAYLVGAAHLAAATSFATRRYMRRSAPALALMFALFVLLMDLPGAISHPTIRIFWSLAARQATFSIGALALLAIVTNASRPARAAALATVARFWTAAVLVFYGAENAFFPQFAPGVPSTSPTAAWVPFPGLIAYATGILFVASGVSMLSRRRAAAAAAWSGWWMTLLTVALYAPQWLMASGVAEQVNAINFVFDTLLFAGTMLVIAQAIGETAAGSGAQPVPPTAPPPGPSPPRRPASAGRR